MRIDAAVSLAKLYLCVVGCLVCPFASNDLRFIVLGKHLRDVNPQWYYLTVVVFFASMSLAIVCALVIHNREKVQPC